MVDPIRRHDFSRVDIETVMATRPTLEREHTGDTTAVNRGTLDFSPLSEFSRPIRRPCSGRLSGVSGSYNWSFKMMGTPGLHDSTPMEDPRKRPRKAGSRRI